MRAWGIALITGAALSLAWLFFCLMYLPGWMPAIFFIGVTILYPAVGGVCLLWQTREHLPHAAALTRSSAVPPAERIRPLRFEA